MNKSIAPLLILLVTCLVSNNILTLVNGDHDDCDNSHQYWDWYNNSCASKKASGASCFVSDECQSNNCYNNVCIHIQTVCRYREQYKKNALVPEDFLDVRYES